VNNSKTLRSLNWINTATGCNPGLNAVTYSYKVLGTNNSWVTLSPTTFSQDYTPFFIGMSGNNSAIGIFNLGATLPTTALLGQ
jgi:hypothetical protein